MEEDGDPGWEAAKAGHNGGSTLIPQLELLLGAPSASPPLNSPHREKNNRDTLPRLPVHRLKSVGILLEETPCPDFLSVARFLLALHDPSAAL